MINDYMKQRRETLGRLIGPDSPAVRKRLIETMLYPQKAVDSDVELMHMARKAGFDLTRLPRFPFAPRPVSGRSVLIGNVLVGERVRGELRQPLSGIVMHGIFTGASGAGKSSAIKAAVPQLIHLGVKSVIFDSQHEYDDLLEVVPPGELLVIDALRDDKDNPFAPPRGVPVPFWIARSRESFRELFLRDGSVNLIGDILPNLYARGRYPTMKGLSETLHHTQFKTGTRSAQYLESLINRVDGLLQGMGPTLDCEEGFDISEVLKRSVVYQIGDLSQDHRIFYVNLKVARVAAFRRG